MDKLKENGFVIALSLVGVVLLACAWYLVVQPWMALGQQNTAVASALKDVKRYTKTSVKEVPSDAVVDRKNKLVDRANTNLDSLVIFYEARGAEFQKYFGDATEAADRGQFFTDFFDRLGEILEEYQSTFNVPSDKQGNLPPKMANFPEKDQGGGSHDIDESMKKLWMTEAIVAACTKLEIGGLKEIDFTPPREQRRARVKPGAVVVQSAFVTSNIPVKITVEMRFGDIKKFISELYKSARVPFSNTRSLSYKKIPGSGNAYSKLTISRPEKPEVAGSEPYSAIIKEPVVEVIIELDALNWKGRRAVEEDVSAEEDDN